MSARMHHLVGAIILIILSTCSIVLASDPPSYVHHKVSMEDAKARLEPHQRRLKAGTQEPAVMEDIKFIRCQVCEEAVQQFLGQIAKARSGLKRHQKLTEEKILEELESVCDVDGSGGEWIKRYDIIEQGDALKLNDTKQLADSCNTECRTIAKACDEVQDTMDFNDISETIVLKKKPDAEIQGWLCSAKTVCKPPPPVPSDRKAGPVHQTIKAHQKKVKAEKRAANAAKKKAAKEAAAAAAAEAAAAAGEESSPAAAADAVEDVEVADEAPAQDEISKEASGEQLEFLERFLKQQGQGGADEL